MGEKDLQWVAAVCYARAAGARGYDEARDWALQAIATPITDYADLYRRLDAIAMGVVRDER